MSSSTIVKQMNKSSQHLSVQHLSNQNGNKRRLFQSTNVSNNCYTPVNTTKKDVQPKLNISNTCSTPVNNTRQMSEDQANNSIQANGTDDDVVNEDIHSESPSLTVSLNH